MARLASPVKENHGGFVCAPPSVRDELDSAKSPERDPTTRFGACRIHQIQGRALRSDSSPLLRLLLHAEIERIRRSDAFCRRLSSCFTTFPHRIVDGDLCRNARSLSSPHARTFFFFFFFNDGSKSAMAAMNS